MKIINDENSWYLLNSFAVINFNSSRICGNFCITSCCTSFNMKCIKILKVALKY